MPDGERGDRLLLTVFDRRTQPLIRYEISDMVTPLAGECECGRPFRLIQSIEGRIEAVLHFNARNGRTGRVAIQPNVFHQLLESVPADGWQVEQETDGVSVWIVGVRDPSLFSPLATQISRALEAQGAQGGAINVRACDSLRRGATGKASLILAALETRS